MTAYRKKDLLSSPCKKIFAKRVDKAKKPCYNDSEAMRNCENNKGGHA